MINKQGRDVCFAANTCRAAITRRAKHWPSIYTDVQCSRELHNAATDGKSTKAGSKSAQGKLAPAKRRAILYSREPAAISHLAAQKLE